MSLHVVVGPMFAGKTSEALRIIGTNRSINRRVLVLKHHLDVRYAAGQVCSHDQHTATATAIAELLPILASPEFTSADVVIIEEAQFFEDLVAFASACVDANKEVHVFGLDGDYQRKPMGHILKLCPLADTFRKINALCIYCQNGTPAPFSLLTTTAAEPEDSLLIGGAEFYSAVCRKHYNSHM